MNKKFVVASLFDFDEELEIVDAENKEEAKKKQLKYFKEKGYIDDEEDEYGRVIYTEILELDYLKEESKPYCNETEEQYIVVFMFDKYEAGLDLIILSANDKKSLKKKTNKYIADRKAEGIYTIPVINKFFYKLDEILVL